jgi:putative copper resistance protein D
LINPLVIVRDIHFASTVIVAGVVFFDLLIASPVLGSRVLGSRVLDSPVLGSGMRFPKAEFFFRETAGKILWISFALSMASAFAWLCLLSMRITGKAFGDVIADGTVWTVLTQTQFGFAWEMRLLFGALLGACMLWLRKTNEGAAAIWLMTAAGLLAGAYLGALALAGHGEEGMDFEQHIHLAADFLHLNAAGLWLGALVPLALLLASLRRFPEDGWVSAAAAAAGRFSTLGILAVGLLLVTGTINAAFLLGGMHSLIGTAYGRLLLLKVILFAAMVSLAGINRQHLLPRLSNDIGADQASGTVRKLVRSTLVEIALGLAILLIVGVLGIMAPANDMAAHVH